MLAPAFYALDKRHLPMFVSLISIAVNFALNWFFTFHLGLGHRGLALSTSLVAMTNFLLLYAMMRRHTGRLETGAMMATLAKCSWPARSSRRFVWRRSDFSSSPATHGSGWRLILDVTLTIAVGAGAFFGAAYLLRVAEVHDVVTMVRRRSKI